MHSVSSCLCLVAACAVLQPAAPERELVLIGLSSARNEELAKDTARARVLARAAELSTPSGIAFVLDRSRGLPMLKLIKRSVASGLVPEVEPRKPRGARATLKIVRTDADLAELAALEVVTCSAEASGLDLAVAQERADRAVFRDAVLRFAAARGLRDAKLFGHVRVVGYRASEKDDTVRVDAQLAVSFGSEAELRLETRKTAVNEELEEVEPPEER